jgi:hypothetical protein
VASIHIIKEQTTPDTPLLLFECVMPDGSIERWCTHQVRVDGQAYSARVLSHNVFEMRGGSEDGVDGVSRVSLTLANADSHFSQLERNAGIKGAKLTVRFAFYDLKTDTATTPAAVLFRGTGNAPEDVTESSMRLSFTSRLNLSRVLLPNVRIQRRCPWMFPKTAAQRTEAIEDGKYSPYYRCGYSPDRPNGFGSLNENVPYTDCNYTRANCEQRGMFSTDGSGRPTRRFGGIEFVPASTLVRSFGESGRHVSAPTENAARYNDFVPMVYGTAWYQPPVVFAQNDGNLTRMEVLLGMGEIQGVMKIVVNGIEIPLGQNGQNMTATGWYNIVSLGNRTGDFNLDFPSGDPYGSMAVLSVVVPNRISDGRSLPKVEALVQGLKVYTFAGNGEFIADAFSNNPAWVLMDVLRRCGWAIDELDIPSFAAAATYCGQSISAKDLNGNTVSIPRYQCNVVLRRRLSAAEVVRGIRNAAALYLVYSDDGKLALRIEGKIAIQQPVKPASSNSVAMLNGGWPVYEFGESGILRSDNGGPALHLFSRPTADTPNRVSVEFQDAFNEYQQDSVSLVDPDDVLLAGQEVAATIHAIGMPNIDQALRIAQLQLNKSIYGNIYVEFETSMKGLGVRPGDIITLTYLKEGYERQAFRVTKIAPKTNFRTATITAQIHDEAWYDLNAGPSGAQRRRRGAGVGAPLPITGSIIDESGEPQFGITEGEITTTDGGATVELTVEFTPPARSGQSRAAIPLLNLAPTVLTTGGSLKGGRSLYYAVSGVDSDGVEGDPSFSVRASVPSGSSTNRVRLTQLSFNPATVGFHVYRGFNPQQMQRIASNVAPAAEFTDGGLPVQLALPPDPNYDHTNFYYRLEVLPEVEATVYSATTIGSEVLTQLPNEFRGMVARITSGKGVGQERTIVSNTETTMTVNPAWDVVPDSTSVFVLAEGGWRFGAMTQTNVAVFSAPNRRDATIQISGRAANVRDEECALEISPLTRWRIGGAAGGALDRDVPPAPVFALNTLGNGALELLGVSFEEFENVRGVAAGTLTIHYWDELQSPTSTVLAASLSAESEIVVLNVSGGATEGALIQVESELMRVVNVSDGGKRCRVERGVYETPISAYAQATPVYHLSQRIAIVPFARDFFGSGASGSFAYTVGLPNVRVAAADLAMTNARGTGASAGVAVTVNIDRGLRTMRGGQMTMQRDGYLAIQSDAAPPLVVSETRAIRDVFATLINPPEAGPAVVRILADGEPYCDLTIPVGVKSSNIVDCFGRAPLPEKSVLTMDILSVGPSGTNSGGPGTGLSVTLRY